MSFTINLSSCADCLYPGNSIGGDNLKTARLVAIVVILLNRGTVTAKELAERFEVSTRTIYRDIEALAEAGIPVYATQGNSGGISLMEGYLLNRTLVTDSEQESMLFALKTLQAVNYPEVDLILDKLGGIFHNSAAADWVAVEFSPWVKGKDEEEKFNTIRRAILADTVLKFQYVNAQGHRSSRTVEPVKLYFKGVAWYLWAWCRARDCFRSFRLTRIRDLTPTPETFTRRILPHPIASGGKKRPSVQLKLKFQPRAAHRVYDDFDDAAVIRKPDGTMEVEVSFPEDQWVYGYLLSYGPDLEVVKPNHIRGILRAKLEETISRYPK